MKAFLIVLEWVGMIAYALSQVILPPILVVSCIKYLLS